MALGFFTGGTISVSNGGTVVTGVGTSFTQVGIGAWFEAENRPVTIASVESDTSLTLALPWGGTALTGSSDFILKPVAESASLALQLARQLQQLLNTLALKGEIHHRDTVPDASVGTDGDTAIIRSTLDMYERVGGAWVLRFEGAINSPQVNALLVFSQAGFDAQPVKDANTLYAITAE